MVEWLAAIRPHPSLASAIIELVEDDHMMPQILYALRYARNTGSLRAWLKVLAEGKEKRVRCIAADVIGEIGDPAAEPELLKALLRKTR